jgi:molybdate transport system substrate-binding protein
VFAAASLERALGKILTDYQRMAPAEKISRNYAGSNTLARQIEATRAADLFFSADEKWMDYLEKKQLVETATRRSLLSNTLVVIGHKASTVEVHGAADLASAGYDKLVLADPELVPAGRYAKAYLSSLAADGGSLWQKVEARVVPTLDVRGVLGAVRTNPRWLGIVYGSDLAKVTDVRTLFPVPVNEAPHIVYPVALLAKRPERERALKLLAYLESPAAADVFRQYGFTVAGK